MRATGDFVATLSVHVLFSRTSDETVLCNFGATIVYAVLIVWLLHYMVSNVFKCAYL